jgi:hypothetical protein
MPLNSQMISTSTWWIGRARMCWVWVLARVSTCGRRTMQLYRSSATSPMRMTPSAPSRGSKRQALTIFHPYLQRSNIPVPTCRVQHSQSVLFPVGCTSSTPPRFNCSVLTRKHTLSVSAPWRGMHMYCLRVRAIARCITGMYASLPHALSSDAQDTAKRCVD